MIDGRLGLPALGVRGTAIASSIASTLGVAFLLVAFLFRLGGAPKERATGFSRHDVLRVGRIDPRRRENDRAHRAEPRLNRRAALD